MPSRRKPFPQQSPLVIFLNAELAGTEGLALQAQSGSVSARNKLITTWLPWLKARAAEHCRRFELPPELATDLVHAAVVGHRLANTSGGLIRAIELFDPTVGCSFATYATSWVTKEFNEFTRDEKQEPNASIFAKRVRRTASDLERYLNRQPTPQEIHAALAPSKKTLRGIENALAYHSLTSLEL